MWYVLGSILHKASGQWIFKAVNGIQKDVPGMLKNLMDVGQLEMLVVRGALEGSRGVGDDGHDGNSPRLRSGSQARGHAMTPFPPSHRRGQGLLMSRDPSGI